MFIAVYSKNMYKGSFKTREEYLAYYRAYRKNNVEKMREHRKRYRDKNGYSNDWNNRNKDKMAAHSILNNAVKRGRIKREPCEMCGDTVVHGHHDDYTKPLEVRWLCRLHHKLIHS